MYVYVYIFIYIYIYKSKSIYVAFVIVCKLVEMPSFHRCTLGMKPKGNNSLCTCEWMSHFLICSNCMTDVLMYKCICKSLIS